MTAPSMIPARSGARSIAGDRYRPSDTSPISDTARWSRTANGMNGAMRASTGTSTPGLTLASTRTANSD